jgi:hypothetical protein
MLLSDASYVNVRHCWAVELTEEEDEELLEPTGQVRPFDHKHRSLKHGPPLNMHTRATVS